MSVLRESWWTPRRELDPVLICIITTHHHYLNNIFAVHVTVVLKHVQLGHVVMVTSRSTCNVWGQVVRFIPADSGVSYPKLLHSRDLVLISDWSPGFNALL